jgi:Phage portal protein/Bacterial CdiA-CT RNAse A domain
MSEPVRRALPPSVFARLADATRYVITGVSPDTWFGPLQPLAPMAPPEVKGRQWDYPFGANLNYIPRAEDGVSFAELRGLADALPLLRAVIETRKDQIAAQSYAIRARNHGDSSASSQAIDQVTRFFARPDRRRSFADWLRMLLEEMLVIDAATIYPRYNRGGSLYALDIIDGATIKPLIGEDGRAPEPPDPAYQQILKGIPAADFSTEELLYLPRNLRAHRLYGMSPVEQIALTVNIALRRDASTLDYYRAGSSPDAFATLPKEWTADQIRSFQDYFDALMSGNLARRRQTKFMPADFKLIEARQPPLKDQYDEWLARIICYAFSVPVSPFVSQVNRATGEIMRQQATQEGLVPLKAWVKNALDHVIRECMNEPGLEFVWVGDDAIDPLEQAQTLQILVGAGIKTREEARADLGLAPAGGKAPVADNAAKALRKFNLHHDERGQFATADGAVATVGNVARKPQPTRVQVASNDPMMSDVSPDTVSPEAQGGRAAEEQVAQASPNLGTSKYSVDLRAEEQLWGGHTIRDHVGKPPAELISEVENNTSRSLVNGIPTTDFTVESTYDSVESANDFINRLLQSNTDKVDQVANGDSDQKWIQSRFGYRTGVEAYPDEQGRITTRETYNAGVLIVHDDRVPRGYRVKTAYPSNDANSYPSPVVSP